MTLALYSWGREDEKDFGNEAVNNWAQTKLSMKKVCRLQQPGREEKVRGVWHKLEMSWEFQKMGGKFMTWKKYPRMRMHTFPVPHHEMFLAWEGMKSPLQRAFDDISEENQILVKAR